MHAPTPPPGRGWLLNKHPLESYSAYLDGYCLSDAEVEGLRSWISANEKNATEFVEFAILHAAVTDRLKLGRLLDDLASHRSPAGITPALLANAIRDIELNSPRVSVQLPPPEPEPEQPSRWMVFAPAAAVAAVLMIGAWGLWQNSDVPLPKPAAPQQPIAAVPQPEPPKIAARLSSSFDAKWLDPGAMSLGQDVLQGARLTLLSGVVQLDMVGGAAVVIEGPTDLELTGPDALRLTQGKTAVRIAEGGGSFVVDTPTMQVIDLGTEFGVETTASGDEQVMVFDGSVALADPTEAAFSEPGRPNPAAAAAERRLEAGFQVSIAADESVGVQAAQPEVLTNPRHFLRPDEVEVRLRALAGSAADRKLAAHFERQRIKGLLAYQGFDAATQAVELTLGTNGQGLQAVGNLKFVDDADGKNRGIEVQGGPVFMQLDTSAGGPFARGALLADSGRIGRSGKEIWISWKSKRMRAAASDQGSAGLSLMFGDRETQDEPVIMGRSSGDVEEFILQSAWGDAPPPDGKRLSSMIDFDVETPGAQDRAIDDQEHSWIARVEFGDRVDRVSVWVDAELTTLDAARPQAVLDVSSIEFDRIRFAVNRGDEIWRFSDFAMALDPRALHQLTQVADFQSDQIADGFTTRVAPSTK
jgi:hypothetical protein